MLHAFPAQEHRLLRASVPWDQPRGVQGFEIPFTEQACSVRVFVCRLGMAAAIQGQ